MNADRINEHYYGDVADPSTERARERIHWICRRASGQDVLDAGCSQGIVCLILAREGFHCTGLDIEPNSLALAEQALAKEDEIVRGRVKFLVADAGRLPFPDESFDTVVLGEILEHLTHPVKVLSEARRVLRKGGRLIVTVPYGLNAFQDHKCTYYPVSLLRLLQPLFKTVTIDTLGNYITYLGVRDDAYDPAMLSKSELFDAYLTLEESLEARCLSKERALLETATKLYAQIRNLNSESSAQTAKMKELSESLKAKEDSVRQLSEELEMTRRSEMALKENMSQIEAHLSAQGLKLREAESQLDARISGLQSQLLDRDHQVQQLEAALKQSRAAESDLRSQLGEAIAQTAAGAATIKELRDALSAVNRDLAALKDDLLESRGVAADLRVVIAKREVEAAGQAARIQDLQCAQEAKDAEIQGLENSLREAQETIGDLRAATAKAEAEAAAQGTRMQELRSSIVTRDGEVQRLEGALRESQVTISDLRTRAAKAEAEFAGQAGRMLEVERNLAAREKDVKRLESALDEARRPVAALRQELVAKDAAWQQRFTKQLQDLTHHHEAEWKRRLAVERIREVVRSSLPLDARVLVISKGDDELLKLDGRLGWHFPQTTGGVYAGFHPANSAEAIAHLESLRAKGVEFLLIPSTSFWWLDFYTEFRRHLESNYRLLVYNEEACLIFALSAVRPEHKPLLALSLLPEPAGNGVRAKDPESAKLSATVELNKLSPPLDLKAPASAELKAPAAPAVKTAASVALPAPVTASVRPNLPPETARVTSPLRDEPKPRKLSDKLAVGCILDEFTAACFRPECDLVTFRPDNWKAVLDSKPINLLFVESAWQGNGGSWQYKIASFKKPMGEELVDVVGYCRERGIPTVFWNKEDPSHFDRFVHRTPLFDIIFTTDADMIPRYRDAVKHERVFALPFAAQPKLHHPILEVDRKHNVCFAGAYYALDHDERRRDIDHILKPSLPFGLHIFDRQHGVVGPTASHYQFPEVYRSAIQGRLEYDQMVLAYKGYKVFLNVNSVKNSPTMCSRRVFELLASGTPVVSSYARGIVELLGKELVHISNSESETTAHLEKLLRDDRYWSAVSAKGIREVFLRHTYTRRFAEICKQASLPPPRDTLPQVEALARLESAREADLLVKALECQDFRGFGLTVIAGKQLPKGKLDGVRAALPDFSVTILRSGQSLPLRVKELPSSAYLWLVDPRDHYGAGFLGDAMRAIGYSGADAVGKSTCYECDSSAKSLKLARPGSEFRFVSNLVPGSIIARVGTIDVKHWLDSSDSDSLALGNVRALATDRFNFVKRGARAAGRNGRALLAEALV